MATLTLQNPPKARKARARKIKIAGLTAEQIDALVANQGLPMQLPPADQAKVALAEAAAHGVPFSLIGPVFPPTPAQALARDVAAKQGEEIADSDDLSMAEYVTRFLHESSDYMRVWGDGAVRDWLDTIIHGLYRRLERYEKAQDAVGQALLQLDRAWDGTEIPYAERQELEERRDRAAQLAERYGLLADAAATAHREITGDAWVPPAVLRKPPPTAILGAAANAMLAGKLVPAADGDYRVVISGGELDGDLVTVEAIERIVTKIKAKHEKLRVATGSNQAGVEAAVRAMCQKHGVPCEVFQPQWSLGKRAGFERNRQMFAEFRPQALVIIGGGGVQANLVEIARAAQLAVHVALPTENARLARERVKAPAN